MPSLVNNLEEEKTWHNSWLLAIYKPYNNVLLYALFLNLIKFVRDLSLLTSITAMFNWTNTYIN